MVIDEPKRNLAEGSALSMQKSTEEVLSNVFGGFREANTGFNKLSYYVQRVLQKWQQMGSWTTYSNANRNVGRSHFCYGSFYSVFSKFSALRVISHKVHSQELEWSSEIYRTEEENDRQSRKLPESSSSVSRTSVEERYRKHGRHQRAKTNEASKESKKQRKDRKERHRRPQYSSDRLVGGPNLSNSNRNYILSNKTRIELKQEIRNANMEKPDFPVLQTVKKNFTRVADYRIHRFANSSL